MISPETPLVLIGAGNMGGAMLRGWLENGLPGASVVVVDPRPSTAMVALLDHHGVRHEIAVPSGVVAGVLMIAVKPQMMDVALPPARALVGDQTLIISIAAGKTIGFFERHLGGAIVRAMPNTPSMIGRGITACFSNSLVTGAMRETVNSLLSVCGPVEWVDEEGMIDAVTAVSGSGPAYVFHLVECMAEAGRKCGLQADLAMRLARATVAGAGELMHRSDDSASVLRQNVTSPQGTTAAALSVLMADGGLQSLMDEAIQAAYVRSQELAG